MKLSLAAQKICVESQSRFEDTRSSSEENSMETTAVVPVKTATGTKYSDNLYAPCSIIIFYLCIFGC
jgi:hypothetical protein